MTLTMRKNTSASARAIGNTKADARRDKRGPSPALPFIHNLELNRASKKRQMYFLKCKIAIIFLAILLFISATTLLQHSKLSCIKCSHEEETLRKRGFRHNTTLELHGSSYPHVEKEISNIIEQYQSVVKSFVNFQSGTWFRYKGWTRTEDQGWGDEVINLTTVESDPLYSERSIETLLTYLKTSYHSVREIFQNSINVVIKRNQLNIDTDQKHKQNKIQEAVSGILWDNEADIPTYFNHLTQECKKNAMIPRTNNSFYDTCFGYLNSLIHEPRCTVRLDSRITCNGSKSRNDPDEMVPNIKPIDSIIGPEHFAHDTINIVVVGGGPVGLFLANALTELQLRRSQRISKISTAPSIRLVVFENRLNTAEYHKKPYSRDWVTYIIAKFVSDAIDPRVVTILELFSDRKIVLSINAIETLLLLSNRNRGVRFVYGNFREYEDILKRVPNLLVFDATGHRLDQLDRGQNDWGEQHESTKAEDNNDGGTFSFRSDLNMKNGNINTNISEWKPEPQEMIETLESEFRHGHIMTQTLLQDLAGAGDAHKIALRHSANSGHLLYPVLKNNKPYAVNFLKILNLPMSEKMLDEMKYLSTTVNNTNPFKNEKYNHFPHSNYDGAFYYREDLYERMKIDDPGFSIRVSVLNLTPEQTYATKRLLHRYGKSSNAQGVALDKIPMEEFTDNKVFRTNKIDEMLHLVKDGFLDPQNYNNSRSPLLTIFQCRPYVYVDPVVPDGFLDGKAPLLRIGDSLMTGDPNLSSGLQHHIYLIRELLDKLWNMYETNDALHNTDKISI